MLIQREFEVNGTHLQLAVDGKLYLVCRHDVSKLRKPVLRKYLFRHSMTACRIMHGLPARRCEINSCSSSALVDPQAGAAATSRQTRSSRGSAEAEFDSEENEFDCGRRRALQLVDRGRRSATSLFVFWRWQGGAIFFVVVVRYARVASGTPRRLLAVFPRAVAGFLFLLNSCFLLVEPLCSSFYHRSWRTGRTRGAASPLHSFHLCTAVLQIFLYGPSGSGSWKGSVDDVG